MTESTGEPDGIEPRRTDWVVPPSWPETAARSHARELYRRTDILVGLALAVVALLVVVGLLYNVGVAVVGGVIGIPLSIVVAPRLRRAKVARELALRQAPGSKLTLVERPDRLELTDESGTHVFPYAEFLAMRPGEHLAILMRRNAIARSELIPAPLLTTESMERISRAVRGG